MSRIKKLELDDWDKELREMTAADSGTPLELILLKFQKDLLLSLDH